MEIKNEKCKDCSFLRKKYVYFCSKREATAFEGAGSEPCPFYKKSFIPIFTFFDYRCYVDRVIFWNVCWAVPLVLTLFILLLF